MGMRVNNKKTQLLCISPQVDQEQKTFIETPDGSKIESGDRLKILGFHFGPKPNVDAHVDALIRNFTPGSGYYAI